MSLVAPALAAADPIIVGEGNPATCTQVALLNALFSAEINGGGTIRFNCGAGPVTIALIASDLDSENVFGFDLAPAALTPPTNTIIDGGGLITLEAPTATVLHIAPNRSVTLEALTIARSADGVFNEGTLTIVQCVFSDNRSITYIGGAAFNVGTLRVNNSVFSNNGSYFSSLGGGITSSGTVSVNQSSFLNNSGASAGGIASSGPLGIKNSILSGNYGEWNVGGVLSLGAMSVDNTELSGNGAATVGAIYNQGDSLLISNSLFSGNHGPIRGGAIVSGNPMLFPTLANGKVSVLNSQFFDNVGARGGAVYSEGLLTLTASTLSRNHAIYGGALYVRNGVKVANTDITGNEASIDGGGIFVNNGGIPPGVDRNSSVSGNVPNNVSTQPER
jgi:hypothetical protein